MDSVDGNEANNITELDNLKAILVDLEDTDQPKSKISQTD